MSNDKKTSVTCTSMKFSELYHTGCFMVPWHQRNYDWKILHVEDLLRDTYEAMKASNRQCYFLSSIILVPHPNQDKIWEINDGQQRMITFSLICARLCRLFAENDDSRNEGCALRILFDLPDTHQERLCSTENLTPRITPPQAEKTNYGRIIRGEDIGSNGKLNLAWKEIDRYIANMDTEEAAKYFGFLLNNIEVACVYIPTESVNQNSVFEAINYRGEKLKDFDLIRNYLYSHLNSIEDRNRRDTAHANIESIKELLTEAHATDYAYCYFQCRYGFLTKDHFYRAAWTKMRDAIKPGKSKPDDDYVFDLINDFTSVKNTGMFSMIINPKKHNDTLEKLIKDSGKMGKKRNMRIFLQELRSYTVAYPILFALLCKYHQVSNKQSAAKHIHRYTKALNAFVMRAAFVVDNFRPSDYMKGFAEFAQQIWACTSLDALDVTAFLEQQDEKGERIMDDDRFIAQLKEVKTKMPKSGKNSKNSKKIKTLLYGINLYGIKDAEQSDGDVIDIEMCTVEHIFPQSPAHQQTWEHFEECDPKDWVGRLGNMTLLPESHRLTSAKENENFDAKKDAFRSSSIQLTRHIVEKYKKWSPEEIQQYQHELAKIAARVWSFSRIN